MEQRMLHSILCKGPDSNTKINKEEGDEGLKTTTKIEITDNEDETSLYYFRSTTPSDYTHCSLPQYML